MAFSKGRVCGVVVSSVLVVVLSVLVVLAGLALDDWLLHQSNGHGRVELATVHVRTRGGDVTVEEYVSKVHGTSQALKVRRCHPTATPTATPMRALGTILVTNLVLCHLFAISSAAATAGAVRSGLRLPPVAALLVVLLLLLPIGSEAMMEVRNHIEPETVCVSRAMCL